jgi:phage host-nuclease inhibitor protein Gam
MAKLKSKVAAEAVAAPRDAMEAAAMVATIGAAMRERQVIEAALAETIALAKERAEAEAKPHAEVVRNLTRAVQLWAEANRAALTEDGKTKTVTLATGRILWRARPPSVRFASVAAVLLAVKTLALGRFVRVKEELNKEAMLAEPDVARTVPGVSIGSAGEDFAIEPDGVQLAPEAGAA